MTMQDAIAQQPAWLAIWVNVLMVGAFIAPLALLIWRQTRVAAAAFIATGAGGAFGTQMIFDKLGYVKLLGLPHIILWTPLAIYLISLLRGDLPKPARWILCLGLATILISLAFNYTDVARYLLGDHAPRALPPT
jgi:hypothetical protein